MVTQKVKRNIQTKIGLYQSGKGLIIKQWFEVLSLSPQTKISKGYAVF